MPSTVFEYGEYKVKHRSSASCGFIVLCLFSLALAGCASAPNSGIWGFPRPAKVVYKDTRWCVPGRLKSSLKKISRRFGTVTVYSTHRWPLENKRKGGKPKSYHLRCKATDFTVPGNPSDVIQYIKTLRWVGGYSYYQKGFYHIDTGPRRTW